MSAQYPWPPERSIEIWRAFGARKRKNQEGQILKFIIVASSHKLIFDANRDDVHPADVNSEIANLRDAASKMASALSSLSSRARKQVILSGAEFGKWISPDARQEMPVDDRESARCRRQNLIDYVIEQYQPSGANRPIWKNQNLILDRLKRYARELEVDATRALSANPITKGTRRKEIQALDLACDLYRSWFIVFGERGSLERGLEFHRVAAEVAKLFGLKIGPRILKKATNSVDVEELLKQETVKK